ncbi:MAG: metallophosphoesterase [Flaviflexus sp.]|nr:metallophosphoesterase [Flaviflexus sp.]
MSRGRALFGAATLLSVAGWSLAEARAFQRSYHTLSILPPGSSRLRILNISDLHILPGDARKVAFMRSLADLEPDAVFLTGDQLSSAQALPTLLGALAPLAGTPGAFVYGSHDYYAPVWKNPLSYLFPALGSEAAEPPELPHAEMTRRLTDYGWIDLRNRRSRIEAGGRVIDLIGVDDPHIDLDVYPPEEADSAVKADFNIGLTHAPYTRILNAYAEEGVDLTLAGHTHGGQICLPGHGALVTNCDLPPRLASGVFPWPGGKPDAMRVAISRGMGTSPMTPFRLACRPEVQIIDLVG